MPNGLVRLNWERDRDGYYIQTLKRPEPTLSSVLQSQGLLIECHRGDSGARLDVPLDEGLHRMPGIGGKLPPGLHWPWKSDVMDFIVPRSGEAEHYEADLVKDPIYLDLADSKQSSEAGEGALEFVMKWGLLWRRWEPQPLQLFLGWRETFIKALNHLENSHGIIRRFRDTNVGKLNASFEVKSGHLQLKFQADTLQQFCVLQLLQAKAGFIDITACARCGRFLRIHKNGNQKEYCTNACRQKAYRQRRAAERALDAP
jgi:hypothetical protein